MKIISWNIYNMFRGEDFVRQGFFTDLNEANNYVDKRIKYFVETLKEMEGDVIYFFEAGSDELIRKIAEGIWGKEYYVFNTTPDKRGIYNCCISKAPLENSETFIDDLEIPGFVIDEENYKNRFLVQRRGYVKTSMNNINIYGVHLKSQLPSDIKKSDGENYTVTNSVEEARTQILGELIGLSESYSIRKLISEDVKNNKEVIMLGDFNADTHSRRLKVLRGLRESNDEMIDLFDVRDLEGYTHIHRDTKMRFDHVLMTKGILEKTTSARIRTDVINVAAENTFLDTNIIGSDHAVIIFDLNI